MKRIASILGILTLVCSLSAVAQDAQYRADSAVADILFEFDGSEQYASYVVNSDGFVDITFARNIPDELYSEILARLQNHDDIDGVLAGTGGPACRLF